MSIRRHNAMRDANDGTLRRVAEQLGWYMQPLDTPCDYLACLKTTAHWYPVEIKTEEGRFTPKQKRFKEHCTAWSMPYLVWRTRNDVIEQTNALRLAAR